MAERDDEARRISKAVFGNAYRLPILAAAAHRERGFVARELAEELGIADNLVTPQLARLADAGLLERRSERGAVIYVRRPSALWEASRQLAAEVGLRNTPRSAPAASPDPQPRDDLPARLPGASPRQILARPLELRPLIDTAIDAGLLAPRDAAACARLTEAAVRFMADGVPTRRALTLDDLSSASGVRPSRLPRLLEHDWPEIAERGIHRLIAERRADAHWELASVTLPAGRANQVLGGHRVKGAGAVQHVLVAAVVTGGAYVPVSMLPLVTGTQDDPARGDPDATRVRHWVRDLRAPPVSSVAEHVEYLLARQRETVRTGGRDAGLAPDFVVVPELSYGPPLSRHVRASARVLPGEDDDIRKAVAAESKAALLFRGRHDSGEVVAEFLDRAPRVIVPSSPPFMTVSPSGVTKEYRWDATEEQIVRVLAPGTAVELWKVHAVAIEGLAAAARTIEHRATYAPHALSLARWSQAVAPSRLRVRSDRTRANLSAMLMLANAVCVCAEHESAPTWAGSAADFRARSSPRTSAQLR